jgi:hypothetical protein
MIDNAPLGLTIAGLHEKRSRLPRGMMLAL